MAKLYIIDASGFIYRSYHAITNMTNSHGESTNALFGFIRSLLKIRKDFNPDYLVAVFDGPNNIAKRSAIYPEYKANRTSMPLDLGYQIRWTQEFCTYFGIPIINIPEVEADDAMGAIAVWGKEFFEEIFLCTSDKDMAQLVGQQIKMLNTHKDNLILDAEGVFNQFGVFPEQIIDYLSITGDSSDNVPGLPGFGPKTAAALLQEFSSLEEILANPLKIPGKKKQETLINDAEKARISKLLVTLDLNIPIPKETTFYEQKEILSPQLKKFLVDREFTSLIKELNLLKSEKADEPKEYILINDVVALRNMISQLIQVKEFCFSVELSNSNPFEPDLVGIAFSIRENHGWYIPVNGSIELLTLLEHIKPLFYSNAKVYSHNLKFMIHVMSSYGIEIKNISFDTILASYILNSQQRQHSLAYLMATHFDKEKFTLDPYLKGKRQITKKDIPLDIMTRYCCEEVDYILKLKTVFETHLKERKLEKLFHDLEFPLLSILVRMEKNGIYLDKETLLSLKQIVDQKLESAATEIYLIADEKFNLNSPKQLSEILFNKLKIPPPKKIASGFSTDVEVLEGLKEKYPIAQLLLEYRTLEKLRSTYIDILPQQINQKTNRIHCTFNQYVAATGRLSCQEPNLQNIPTRSEIGKNIRQSFCPQKKGWSYLSADYSQIELRLLAHFSEDPNLLAAFIRGEDIHAHTAAKIFNIPLENVTQEMRYRAKAVNFGIVYGQQAFGLSKELGIDFKEAKQFIDTYFQTFPKVKDYLESCKEKARNTGRSVTYVGRERMIPEMNSKNPQIRSAAERLAINTPLQGSAADLIKESMIHIDHLLQKENLLSYMILQIHDELIFEIPDFEIPFMERMIKNSMENIWKLKIPLVVNISIGKNWKEC